MTTIKAMGFQGEHDLRLEEVDRPRAGVGEAVIRVTWTTICGTDLHIVRGEYPVKPGLIIGHEPVGVIEELGPSVTGYEIGDRPLVGAVVIFAQGPSGLCAAAGAKLMGTSLIIGIDGNETLLAMARRTGANMTLDYHAVGRAGRCHPVPAVGELNRKPL